LPHFLVELGKIRCEFPRNAIEQFVFGENQCGEFIFYPENKLKPFLVFYIFRAVRIQFRVVVILVKIDSLKALLFWGRRWNFIYACTLKHAIFWK